MPGKTDKLGRLFVTGGAGHTGCNFLQFYLSDNTNNEVVVLVRRDSNTKFLPQGFGDRMRLVKGDLKEDDISHDMANCDAVMHIAHQTLCPQVTAAALKAGIQRVFFVTTTGVFSKFNDLSSAYCNIEEGIRTSALQWTILRPTMIFGSERDANMHKLLRYLNRTTFFPIFGDGKSLMQPVYAADLAAGLLLSVKNSEKTISKEYNLAGRSPLSYNEIVQLSAKELGRKARLIHVPLTLSLFASQASELILGRHSPIASEQVRRLTEDKAYSWTDARDDFGYCPGDFVQNIALEIQRLRSIGLLT